jgi:hypothetical protein
MFLGCSDWLKPFWIAAAVVVIYFEKVFPNLTMVLESANEWYINPLVY